MQRIQNIILLLLIGMATGSFAQEVKVISFKEFEEMTRKNNDTTYLFNFWATWCTECVKELPNIEQINNTYLDKKVKVIFISLDFKKDLEKRLIPFVANHHLISEVYLLNDVDYNSWIDKVDKDWDGSIPATLIVNNSKNIRLFYRKEFTFAELENIILKIIK